MYDALVKLLTEMRPTVEAWSAEPWFAWVLFAILFAETGLVVTPFLPGDSLLFTVGAIVGGRESRADLPFLLVLMSVAAVLGDGVNYHLGRWAGPAVFRSERSRLLNRKHLLEAQAFYEKYGAKTIVLARFVPVVRTFAPFVAGIGRMSYPRFAAYNVVGGVGWVMSLTMAGVWFGGIPWVRDHFEHVVYAIVVVSVLPVVVEILRARAAARRGA
jgi:membrane-associated protein